MRAEVEKAKKVADVKSRNRLPRRSGTGFVRLIAMKAADRMARPAPNARS